MAEPTYASRRPNATAKKFTSKDQKPKVWLTDLWQRTSAGGSEYLFGYLGKAHLIGFLGDPRPDGTLVWRIYIQPNEDPPPRASAPPPKPEQAAEDEPFFNDELPEYMREPVR